MKKNNREKGFTLVEILVVTVILAVISLAIFSTFSSGLKIYKRLNSGTPAQELVIFGDRFGWDLRNCVNFSAVNFTGSSEELEFASLVNSRRLGKKTVGKIKYAFDSSYKRLRRSSEDYSALYAREAAESRHALENVTACVFSYYYFDNKTKSFAWGEEWKKTGLPAAVRMELEFEKDPETKVTRVFGIPVGHVVLNETSDK